MSRQPSDTSAGKPAKKPPLDLSDPVVRKQALRHVRWRDHGILRVYWHNFDEFAPGAFRSNQPTHDRFAQYAALGIKTVLNLRGAQKQPPYQLEQESCAALGIKLVNCAMSARQAPRQKVLIKLLGIFDDIDRPFLMHCKSGADRTGLAAALYLMVQENVPFAVARQQLGFRYIHIRRTATGVLDHFLDVYAARNANAPIAIDDWIRNEYDADALTESFAAKQAALKPWQGWR
ncbi:fused DSP-PTPase phosphatase/NAD kinase-like protein [Loktanella agnita]|uniref:fused DSP-PTPase phosphatase/NAD kinase-like protein n=1 Tax=Loktanella agnita TaxID=287097 RepID=UPI0039880F0C